MKSDNALAEDAAGEPTDADRATLTEVAVRIFGDSATAEFMGVRAKGVKGDAAHYGHAVILTLPAYVGAAGTVLPYDLLDEFTHEVHARIECAGNVTLDVTTMAKAADLLQTRYNARPYGDTGALWYVEDGNLGGYLVSLLHSREDAKRYASDLNAADARTRQAIHESWPQ